MQLRRNEILTGLLVVGTVVVVAGILILLGAPGLFRPLVTYHIYFDNASGIKLGAPVMLAGRKVGQVEKLYSPVSREEDRRAQEALAALEPDATPAPSNGKPKFEVRIDVQVDKSGIVYRDSKVRLISLGLLGETAIDFTQGTENSGRAHDGDMFAGERVADFGESISKMLDIIQPVAKEATATMKELEATAQNLSRITDENSELNRALAEFKSFGENLVDLTSSEGALTESLNNIEKISGELAANNNLEITLQNFRDSSEKLKSMMSDLAPSLKESGLNIKEFSETIKAQPWRLIWPSTKKSPSPPPAPAETTITVRKSTKAAASPSPARRSGGR